MADRRDADYMGRAINVADASRLIAPPNPWVGAAIASGTAVFTGATSQYGGPHAEINALAEAGEDARGATMYTTLEPCCHQGQTGPCTEAIINAGITRVVIALADPDPLVAGKGIERLRAAGIEVDVGCWCCSCRTSATPVSASSAHRPAACCFEAWRQHSTGSLLRPIAPANGLLAPRPVPIATVYEPRATHSLSVLARFVPTTQHLPSVTSLLLVLTATRFSHYASCSVQLQQTPVHSRLSSSAANSTTCLLTLLAGAFCNLWSRVVPMWQVPSTARGLIDRYVIYLAPALFGGDDARPLFSGPGAPTIGDIWRGEIIDVRQLGSDVRIEMRPRAN